jgi:endonuclease-3
LDQLIFTVLTQHTSDSNAEVAYNALRKRYSSWSDVLGADTEELAGTIRSGGLANQKAPRIQAILHEVLRLREGYTIEFLKDLPLDEAKDWLISLPGVGPKTAAVTLAFSLGMPAMPVDTHIYRVGKRLGLITMRTSVDDAHDVMEAQVAPDDIYAYHVLLIAHGRRTCKAQRPVCGDCALLKACPSRSRFQAAEQLPNYRRPQVNGKPL